MITMPINHIVFPLERNRVFVPQIPAKSDPQVLSRIFSNYGAVEEVYVSGTKYGTGYAIITFQSRAIAEFCIKMCVQHSHSINFGLRWNRRKKAMVEFILPLNKIRLAKPRQAKRYFKNMKVFNNFQELSNFTHEQRIAQESQFYWTLSCMFLHSQ